MSEIELIKKYEKKRNVAIAVIFAFAILVLMIPISLLWKILLLIFDAIVMIIYFWAYSESIEKILHDELNPQKYYTVIQGLDIGVRDRLEDVAVAYFLGDYGNAIGIAENQLPKIKSKNIKNEMKNYLAWCYFETGELDKLSQLISEETELSKKDGFAKIKFYHFSKYFKDFINGEFDKCQTIYELMAQLPKELKTKSLDFTLQFYTGLALYYGNEFEKAKECFENCVKGCSSFNYAVLSKKYINEIENKTITDYDEMKAPSTEYTPQQTVVLQKTKMNKKDIAKLIVCAVVVVGAIVWANIDNIKSTPVEAISDYCEIEEVLTYVPIDEENSIYVYNQYNFVIGLAAVETKNQKNYNCNITSYYDPDYEEGLDFEYGFDLANIDKSVTYKITDNKDDIPKDVVSSEFVFDNGIEKRTFYIYIVRIEDYNTWFYSAW